jgi:hypothetical protein
MVDVRLLYPLEKEEAASRLAEAVAEAGYRVEREALANVRVFPRLAAEARETDVLLLIWSRTLVTAAMAAGGLAEARRLPNLVEVSADGIEPDSGPEISPVVLLCGWRGQPFHPGWQRILGEIERLCGSKEAPRKAARVLASDIEAAPRKPAPKRPEFRAAVAAGVLVAATLAAATVLQRSSPDAAPGAETRPAPADPLPSPGGPRVGTPVAAASPPPVEGPRAPPAGGLANAAAPIPRERAAAAAAEAIPADRRGRERSPATQRTSPKRLAAVSERGVKRYSRKYSKTMRLFCRRSGRSTPQCRTFARSIRNLRG